MARLSRICIPGISQHVIQRGNNRQICFASDEDFAVYAHWLDEYAKKFDVAIHAWVFMTNHVHLLMTPSSGDGVSRLMQSLGRSYVRYFNKTYRRSGTLWEGRFKSSVIDSEHYLLLCQRYIELNPVRAGMVDLPEEYVWSSYHANALGKPTKIWTPHPAYIELAGAVSDRLEAYRSLFRTHIDIDTVKEIQSATNQGMALGSERFKREVAKLAGRRVTPLTRGPRPKKK